MVRHLIGTNAARHRSLRSGQGFCNSGNRSLYAFRRCQVIEIEIAAVGQAADVQVFGAQSRQNLVSDFFRRNTTAGASLLRRQSALGAGAQIFGLRNGLNGLGVQRFRRRLQHIVRCVRPGLRCCEVCRRRSAELHCLKARYTFVRQNIRRGLRRCAAQRKRARVFDDPSFLRRRRAHRLAAGAAFPHAGAKPA